MKQVNKHSSTHTLAVSLLIVFSLLIVLSQGIYISGNNINVSIGSNDRSDKQGSELQKNGR